MSSPTLPSSTSINIPQIIAVALVSFLAIRWLMKPASPTSSASAAGVSSSRGRSIDVSKVNQVSAMFPQLDRRAIAWDLSRNGQNVSATTERVLGGRGLDTPPPSFQPPLPAAPGAAGSGVAAGGRGQAPKGSSLPDLITRYDLQRKVNGKGKEPEPSEEQRRSAWSADKAARAEGFKRRREEMVLAARRKMMEREAESTSGA